MTAKSPVPTPAARSYLNRLGLSDQECKKVIALARERAAKKGFGDVTYWDVVDAVEELGLGERTNA